MKKILVAFLSIGVLFTASQAFADNIGPGLGRVLLEGKSGKGMELLGTCLNGTSGNGTFAITSGTLGYKDGALIGVNIVDVYVAQNMDNLAIDIAKGEGEYVDTLAHLMEVEDKAAFISKLNQNFNSIFTSEAITSEQVAENIRRVHKA